MRRGTATEMHLREEAASVERFTARLRLVVVVILSPLLVVAMVFGGFPAAFVTASSVMAVVYAAASFAVDLYARRSGSRPWLAYAAVGLDVLVLTFVGLAGSYLSEAPTLALKSPLAVGYFLVIALAALRQSAALGLFAGAMSAAGYASFVAPVLVVDPALFLPSGVFDLDSPGVAPIRIVVVPALFMSTGALAAVGAVRTRRLVTRALDTVTFLFADLRDYTPFLETLGDTAGAALVTEYRRIVRGEIKRTAGREVKTEGDSFLIAFDSARQALECAIGILQVAEMTRARRPELPLHIGIGLNAGEPVVQEGDYVGLAVNIAARLGQQAAAGELLVSELVRGLLRAGGTPPMTLRPGLVLKGITDQPHVYAVAWSGSAG